MRVLDVLAVPVRSGFFRDDQASIREGAAHDGFLYEGGPGRRASDGARGRHSGLDHAAARERPGRLRGLRRGPVRRSRRPRAPHRPGRSSVRSTGCCSRRSWAGTSPGSASWRTRSTRSRWTGGRCPPAAVRHLPSPAGRAAQAAGLTMAEVVRDEYVTGVTLTPVPLYAQSGDERYTNVDKMITKQVDVFPHGLINTVEGKLGSDGRAAARLRRMGARPHRRARCARLRAGHPHRRLRHGGHHLRG